MMRKREFVTWHDNAFMFPMYIEKTRFTVRLLKSFSINLLGLSLVL